MKPDGALLEIAALRGGYGRVEVLRGIDLQLHAGETVALLGSNGAGKSTLNNTVCGLVPAWAGHVRFAGQDLTHATSRAIVQAGLIQVPEGRRVFPNLSVRENLELGSYARARAARRTWSGCSACSRSCASATRSAPARSAAASSRCWRSAAA